MKAHSSRQPILQMMLGSKPTSPVRFSRLDRALWFHALGTRQSLHYRHHRLTDQAFTGATTSFPSVLQQVLQLYPDDPSLGSPYDPTNTTASYRFYGGTNQYKRLASLVGDLLFQSGELLVFFNQYPASSPCSVRHTSRAMGQGGELYYKRTRRRTPAHLCTRTSSRPTRLIRTQRKV